MGSKLDRSESQSAAAEVDEASADDTLTQSLRIERVAVIGSGVMGAGIAAHCANAGCEVMLLDIVPDGVEDRDSLAKGAITKMLKSDPEMLMHKSSCLRC